MFFHNRMFGLIHRGDFNAIPRLEREVGATAVIPGYTESREIVGALNANSVSRAQNACQNNDAYTFNIRCMLILAKLGDQDSAYALAAKLYPRRVGRTAAETEQIWLAEPDLASPEFISSPGAAALRRDPRFFQLAQRIGLVAYWRSGRTPDFCRKNPEPLCPQLLGRN